MYEYIKGTLVELTPTYVVVETASIAYHIEISVQTYSAIQPYVNQMITLYLHPIVREDAHLLFGFYGKEERELFRYLISVSGIGANTARTILSAISNNDLKTYIQQAKISELKNIKGIGQKTAERIVVELRDKIGKVGHENIFIPLHNTIKEEALSALLMLGYSKNMSEKVIDKILSKNPHLSTEELIKQALKEL